MKKLLFIYLTAYLALWHYYDNSEQYFQKKTFKGLKITESIIKDLRKRGHGQEVELLIAFNTGNKSKIKRKHYNR